ncbi:MAG: ion transporter [Bacteroidota bacterium]
MESFRKKVNDALRIKIQKEVHGLSFVVNISLSVLIFLNTIAIILHTVPSLKQRYDQWFLDFEVFSVIIFTLEYMLRIWSIVEQNDYEHPIKGRLKYIFSAWGIIDFLAIFPFYFSLFSTDLGFVRVLRVLRILRLFRVSKYFHALRVIQNVFLSKKEELILSLAYILFLLFIASSLMYFLEHEVQPKVFTSIPASIWWGVNAMTTVGYGDMLPSTGFGKVLSGFVSILGISSFALPTSILASGFAEHLAAQKGIKCPHCGETMHLHHD